MTTTQDRGVVRVCLPVGRDDGPKDRSPVDEGRARCVSERNGTFRPRALERRKQTFRPHSNTHPGGVTRAKTFHANREENASTGDDVDTDDDDDGDGDGDGDDGCTAAAVILYFHGESVHVLGGFARAHTLPDPPSTRRDDLSYNKLLW